MGDWTVYLHLLTAPVLVSWSVCGAYRMAPSRAGALAAGVWADYLAQRQARPVSSPQPTSRGRHRAVVEVYRTRTRPYRHSPEYFIARDTDTGELPAIGSD